MLAASTAATLLDVLSLLVLVTLAWIPAGLAAAIGCLVGGAANFTLSRLWVFGERGRRAGWPRQLALYVVTVVAAGALLSGGIVHFVVHLGVSVLVAKALAATFTMAFWNYPVQLLVVFKKESP